MHDNCYRHYVSSLTRTLSLFEFSYFMFCTVIDHATEELTNSSIPVDYDAIEECEFLLTPTCSIAPSTSCQLMATIVTPIPSSVAMVQQNKVSSDDCNVAAIVVPIILVIIASAVAVCIVIFMVVRWKKATNKIDTSTSTKKEENIFVVTNDLYQLVRCI